MAECVGAVGEGPATQPSTIEYYKTCKNGGLRAMSVCGGGVTAAVYIYLFYTKGSRTRWRIVSFSNYIVDGGSNYGWIICPGSAPGRRSTQDRSANVLLSPCIAP